MVLADVAHASAETDPKQPSDLDGWIAGDCNGLNFFEIDHSLRSLLPLYMDEAVHQHMTPHYARLGAIAGNELDDLARMADRHPPVLHPRDRFGRDEDWIEYHPAYREMERIAYGDFGLHCMATAPACWAGRQPVPPIAKYVFQYLFVQGGVRPHVPGQRHRHLRASCSRATATSTQGALPGPHAEPGHDHLFTGAQFMTEKAGGSDVGAIETATAPDPNDGDFRLYGEKWFCSHTDADVAHAAGRPGGRRRGHPRPRAVPLPRTLDDGSRNAYRIVRLKDKLGTRSMASGEIRLEGALACRLAGEPGGTASSRCWTR